MADADTEQPIACVHLDDTDDRDDWAAYRFYADRELWERWADTVPRSVALYERLGELIEQDANATSGGYDDMEERSARLLATRIQHRGRTAKSALENGNDEKVREELEQMIDIAMLFED